MQTKSFIRFAVIVLAYTLAVPVWADEQPEVSFIAVGVGGLKFSGKTTEIRALQEGEAVLVKVVLKRLQTGISLRDKHMTEKYLQVDQFPEAELKVAKSALRLPTEGEVSGEASGTLSLHGKSQPVTFKYRANKASGGFGVEGTLRLNLKDFGIDVPSYLGVTVKPDVDIQAKFTFPSK